MRTHARAVVIGGGVVGVSTLYHLARKGWSDSVLVERRELTSGSTWHAAGLLPLFNLSYSVGQIHKYSVALYRTLEKESGLDVGLRKVSNIRLARTRDRMDEYHYYAGVAATIGVTVKFLTPQEVKEIWPLCNVDGIIGAIQHPEDGYIQPADLTQALARAARERGAEINRHTTVIAIERRPSGEWKVATDKGDIVCEHVVSATGNFARATGRMVGINVPVIPVQHQYIVTEAHPEILARKAKGLPEMGVLRESDSSWYMREEAGGLLLGPYEKGAPACYVDGPSADSEYELFPEDLDRLAPHIETAIARVPAFGEAGVKKVYNGAIAYTPDGSPIVGPAPGLKNFWLNEGHSFGVTAAGGAGWQLAEWIVDGEPTIDMLGVDPRRFGAYAETGYLIEKNEEAYARVFTVHYPDEERVAARPLRQTPCYSRMKALGAVFGSIYGWERPNFFAPTGYGLNEAELAKPDVLLNESYAPAAEGEKPREKWSFRWSNYLDFVGAECGNVRDNVGLQDMSAFAKLEVSGPGAESWLNSILTNRIPKSIGRVTLTYLLTARGGVRAEFTLTRIGPERFYLVSAGGAGSPRLRFAGETASRRRRRPDRQGDDAARRARARRAPVARGAGQGRRHRRLERGVPMADRAAAVHPGGGPHRHAGQFRRRAGLRTAPPDRDAELYFRRAHGRRRTVRDQAVRHSRNGFTKAGKVLQARRPRTVDRVRRPRIRARPVRRFQEGAVSRPRRAGHLGRQGLREQARHARGPGRERRRRPRLRAGDERRSDGRAHDIRRLRLADRQIVGAGDGEAGALEHWERGRRPHSGRDAPRDRGSRQPL